MVNGRPELDTHIVPPTQQLSIGGYQSGANLFKQVSYVSPRGKLSLGLEHTGMPPSS